VLQAFTIPKEFLYGLLHCFNRESAIYLLHQPVLKTLLPKEKEKKAEEGTAAAKKAEEGAAEAKKAEEGAAEAKKPEEGAAEAKKAEEGAAEAKKAGEGASSSPGKEETDFHIEKLSKNYPAAFKPAVSPDGK
jgi:hypothetical protein